MRCHTFIYRAALAAAIATSASADPRYQMKLWGIDTDDAQLFAISDIERPHATFTDFGALAVVIDGEQIRIGGDIGAFTVIEERRGYVAVNRDIGPHVAPVLLELNLRELVPGLPPVASVVGSLDVPTSSGAPGRVTGIAGDPFFGAMYLAVSDGDHKTPDRLYSVEAAKLPDVAPRFRGEMTLGDDAVTQAGDIAVGPFGRLLVTDEAKRRVVVI
ncbi:MAG: hypothetical protein AAF235_09315, partial [Planctomycetota bacterium]